MTGDALDKGSPDVYFLSRSHRENATTVIILCDIDHFKGVNDSFGHLVGDEVLRETAKRLLASVRTYDFVGRYGGEEFLVVLNNCDPTFALARAEEIRNTIAQRPVQTSTGPVPLTISLGMLLSHEWGTRTVEELLHEADRALYEAKRAGRNCVKLVNANAAGGLTESHVDEPVRVEERLRTTPGRKFRRSGEPTSPSFLISPGPSFAASPPRIRARAFPARLLAACRSPQYSEKGGDS
jgi:diguanylate cyclase (GGDEF)-like protein